MFIASFSSSLSLCSLVLSSCSLFLSLFLSSCSSFSTMAGLISPKPVPYLQHTSLYNPYQRGPSAYSETPPAQLAHPVPHQGSQFMGNNLGPNTNLSAQEDGKIYGLVIELMDPNLREGALLELSKKREQYDDLALVLWHSFGMCNPLPIGSYTHIYSISQE